MNQEEIKAGLAYLMVSDAIVNLQQSVGDIRAACEAMSISNNGCTQFMAGEGRRLADFIDTLTRAHAEHILTHEAHRDSLQNPEIQASIRRALGPDVKFPGEAAA